MFYLIASLIVIAYAIFLSVRIHILDRKGRKAEVFDGAIGVVNLLVAFVIQPVLDHYWWMIAKEKNHAGYERQFSVCAFVCWGIILMVALMFLWKIQGINYPDQDLQIKCFLAGYVALAVIAWWDRRDCRKACNMTTS